MSNNKGMHTKSYTQITSWHSSNTPSACGGDHLFAEGLGLVGQVLPEDKSVLVGECGE